MTEFNFREEIEEELEKQFPKGECKERGNALVLFAIVILKFEEFIRLLKEKLVSEDDEITYILHEIIDKLAGDDLINYKGVKEDER